MRIIFALGMLVIVLNSCKPKTPDYVLSPEKMQVILYDIHMADGLISGIANQDSAKLVGAAYYKGIYTKFGIDSARYTQSMDYYFAQPDKLAAIYDKVTASLKKTKDSLDKVMEKKEKLKAAQRAKIVKDSLAKIKAKVIKPAPKSGLKDSAAKLKVIQKLKK